MEPDRERGGVMVRCDVCGARRDLGPATAEAAGWVWTADETLCPECASTAAKLAEDTAEDGAKAPGGV